MSTFTPPPVLQATTTRLVRAEFMICNPPEPIYEVDEDGNTVVDAGGNPVPELHDGKPKFRFARLDAEFQDLDDEGRLVRRESRTNDVLEYTDTLALARVLKRVMGRRCDETGLKPG